LTLEDTGDWVASARFEWPVFGPIPEQGEAQYMASGLLGAPESQLVGYEVLAGVDTIRVGYFPSEGEWFEAWVDSEGLVMRLMITTGDLSDLTAMTWIWNVETLDTVLEGPLPPGL